MMMILLRCGATSGLEGTRFMWFWIVVLKTSVLSQYCSIAGSIIRATHWACSWFILPPNLLMPVMLAVTWDHWDQTENCQENCLENCLGNDGRFFHHSGATNGEPVTNVTNHIIWKNIVCNRFSIILQWKPIWLDLLEWPPTKHEAPCWPPHRPNNKKQNNATISRGHRSVEWFKSIWRRHAETAKYFRNSAQQNCFSA